METLYFVYVEDPKTVACQAIINPQDSKERDAIIRSLGMGSPVSREKAFEAIERGAVNENIPVPTTKIFNYEVGQIRDVVHAFDTALENWKDEEALQASSLRNALLLILFRHPESSVVDWTISEINGLLKEESRDGKAAV